MDNKNGRTATRKRHTATRRGLSTAASVEVEDLFGSTHYFIGVDVHPRQMTSINTCAKMFRR